MKHGISSSAPVSSNLFIFKCDMGSTTLCFTPARFVLRTQTPIIETSIWLALQKWVRSPISTARHYVLSVWCSLCHIGKDGSSACYKEPLRITSSSHCSSAPFLWAPYFSNRRMISAHLLVLGLRKIPSERNVHLHQGYCGSHTWVNQ